MENRRDNYTLLNRVIMKRELYVNVAGWAKPIQAPCSLDSKFPKLNYAVKTKGTLHSNYSNHSGVNNFSFIFK